MSTVIQLNYSTMVLSIVGFNTIDNVNALRSKMMHTKCTWLEIRGEIHELKTNGIYELQTNEICILK